MLYAKAPKRASRALDQAAEGFLGALAEQARRDGDLAKAFVTDQMGIDVDRPEDWESDEDTGGVLTPAPRAMALGERATLLVGFRDSAFVLHPDALAEGLPPEAQSPPQVAPIPGSEAFVVFQDGIVEVLDASGATTRIADGVLDLRVRPGGLLVEVERDGVGACSYRPWDGGWGERLEGATLSGGVLTRDANGRITPLDVDGSVLVPLGKGDTVLDVDPVAGRVVVHRERRPQCVAVLAVPSGEVVASVPSGWVSDARLLEGRAVLVDADANWTILDLATGVATRRDRQDGLPSLFSCVVAGPSLVGVVEGAEGARAVMAIGAESRQSEPLDGASLLAVGGSHVAVVVGEERDGVVLLDRETLAVRARSIGLRSRAAALALSPDTLAVLCEDGNVELFTLTP